MFRRFITGVFMLVLSGCTTLADEAAPALPVLPKASIAIIGGTYMNDEIKTEDSLAQEAEVEQVEKMKPLIVVNFKVYSESTGKNAVSLILLFCLYYPEQRA